MTQEILTYIPPSSPTAVPSKASPCFVLPVTVIDVPPHSRPISGTRKNEHHVTGTIGVDVIVDRRSDHYRLGSGCAGANGRGIDVRGIEFLGGEDGDRHDSAPLGLD